MKLTTSDPPPTPEIIKGNNSFYFHQTTNEVGR